MINREIAARRLRNQLIDGRKARTPALAVQRLGALQAQDYTQAIWAIGMRTRRARVADVERAIADRRIVLTWAMRGTLHAVPAEDAPWMVRRLTPRVLAGDKRRREQLGLDPGRIAQCEEVVYRALKEAQRMTRQTLMQRLEHAGIETKPPRGNYILWLLAQMGLICLGPKDGKQQTFVLLEDWVPEPRRLSDEEALGELAGRYFAGHGPATVHDFAWWSGLSLREARDGLEAARGGDALHREMFGGVEYWSGRDGDGDDEGDAGAADPSGDQSAVHLLPGYDEYLLGYKDRSAVLEPAHAPRLAPGGNGVFAPMLVVDGAIAGTWKRTIKRDGIELSLSPFFPIGNLRERVGEAARRYGEFVGMPLRAEVDVFYAGE